MFFNDLETKSTKTKNTGLRVCDLRVFNDAALETGLFSVLTGKFCFNLCNRLDHKTMNAKKKSQLCTSKLFLYEYCFKLIIAESLENPFHGTVKRLDITLMLSFKLNCLYSSISHHRILS